MGGVSASSWATVDDPVMGGASNSTLATNATDGGFGRWSGTVQIVPYLGDPGFATVRSVNFSAPPAAIENTTHIILTVRNAGGDTDLRNFDVQLRTGRGMGTWSGKFELEPTSDFTEISLPWTSFALGWRGQKMPATAPLDQGGQLSKLNQLGLSTSGTAGDFSVDSEWQGCRREREGEGERGRVFSQLPTVFYISGKRRLTPPTHTHTSARVEPLWWNSQEDRRKVN